MSVYDEGFNMRREMHNFELIIIMYMMVCTIMLHTLDTYWLARPLLKLNIVDQKIM